MERQVHYARSDDLHIAYLVAGSGIGFEDMGLHRLKGVPGNWRLFAANRPGPQTWRRQVEGPASPSDGWCRRLRVPRTPPRQGTQR